MCTPKPCATCSPSPLAALAPCPLPAERQVRIVQDLQDTQVREGDNAVFTCEASHRDVKGEWFRDGEKIKVSATVKIRQEGGGAPGLGLGGGEFKQGEFVWTKGGLCPLPAMGAHHHPLEAASPSPGTRHFLLLCGVRPEDAGLIRFTAGTAISEASLQVEGTGTGCEGWLGSSTRAGVHQGQLVGSSREPAHPTMPTASSCPPALPIRIVKPLRDKTVLARHKATLECTVSHARGRVRWLRGDTEIFASDKYEICNLDCYRTLIIHRVGPEDEDSYTCDAFDDRSTARLLVEGEGAPGGGTTGGWWCHRASQKRDTVSPVPIPHCLQGSECWGGGSRLDMGPGVCAPLVWDTPFGCPASPGDAAALPDSHCPCRELGARMRCSGAAHRQTDAAAGRWAHASPRMYGHTDTIPSLLRPQGSALNIFF